MIVELEKMKQHRTVLAAHMYTLHDGLSEEACEFAVKMMDTEITKLEGKLVVPTETKQSINLAEFLAWVQDNYTEIGDDMFEAIGVGTGGFKYTREQVVADYLNIIQKGGIL